MMQSNRESMHIINFHGLYLHYFSLKY